MLQEISPCGFANLGNTCYMNSVIQSLLSSTIFNTAIFMYIKEKTNSIDNCSVLLQEYLKIVCDLLFSNYNVYPPLSFKSAINKNIKQFKGKMQHDAHEFLSYLLNNIVDDTRDKELSNVIKNTFCGNYKVFRTCERCGIVKENIENFTEVLLPIPKNSNNPTLEDCFNDFASCERINDNIICEVCKKKSRIILKYQLNDIPSVLIIILKRFECQSMMTNITKISTPVEIYEHIRLDGKRLKLISIVNHYGGVGGGHYVAHIERNNKWYKANDSTISSVNIDSILNDPSNYILVYQYHSE